MSHLSRWIGLALMVAVGMAWPSIAPGQGPDPTAPPSPVLPRQIRENGPPAERPEDDPGPAPGPGLFYVPGEYYPDRDGVVWREGYWAQEQPGWAWIPDRWVRQSDGWAFQEGSWVRTRDPRAAGGDADAVGAAGRDENEIVINLPAGGAPSVTQAGVTYNLFDTVASPYAFGYGGLGITPAYTGVPFYGYPFPQRLGFWGPGWGFGGWGSPYGLGWGGLGWGGLGWGGFGGWGWGRGGWGWGFGPGGLGFGLGIGYRPFLW